LLIVAPSIAIAGLSCAGKTTHAQLLADTLGYDYVSSSASIARRAGVPIGRASWRSNGEVLEAARTDDALDRAVDDEMVARATVDPPAVLDTWALPYIYDEARPLVRVRLDSTLAARAIRLRLALARSTPELSQRQAEAELAAKDEATAERLRRVYGIDILSVDRQPFDVVLDTSTLVSAPTLTAATTGIAIVHRLLVQEVDRCFETGSRAEAGLTVRRGLAGCVVLNALGHLLLLHRRTSERTQWELPGGHIQPGEQPAQAAERKLREEAGLDVIVARQLGSTVFGEGEVVYEYNWFLGRLRSGTAQLAGDVFDGLQYFPLAELDEMKAQGRLSVNAEHLVEAISRDEISLDQAQAKGP
jgi:cytidylate kinase/8-oxo-dGTP pyrophosphatase MutT (NUDIX family)